MPQKKYATFFIGESLFGIDILLVREIIHNIEITPVDLAHESIRGLINLRGQLVTIFDLATLIEAGKTELNESTCSIVLKTQSEIPIDTEFQAFRDTIGEDMCGFIVDRIGDIVTADTTQFEAPPASISGVRREAIEHVIKFENELIVILNMVKLFLFVKQPSQ